MLPYKSDGGRGARWAVRSAVVGRLIVWSVLDPCMGQRTTTRYLALEDGNCNVFQNAEINISLRDIIQRDDLIH